MNILEEFWYGNIEPAEYDTSSSKEYKELLQLISWNEDKLLATMTEEQKELFTKYADCVLGVHDCSHQKGRGNAVPKQKKPISLPDEALDLVRLPAAEHE